MTYDKTYKEIKNVFGSEPEEILKKYYERIEIANPILDIGAGQGRNSFSAFSFTRSSLSFGKSGLYS